MQIDTLLEDSLSLAGNSIFHRKLHIVYNISYISLYHNIIIYSITNAISATASIAYGGGTLANVHNQPCAVHPNPLDLGGFCFRHTRELAVFRNRTSISQGRSSALSLSCSSRAAHDASFSFVRASFHSGKKKHRRLPTTKIRRGRTILDPRIMSQPY